MSQPPSFLNAVTERILEGAKTLEDHVDADSLVARIVAEASPTSRGSRKALGELKYLARRAPGAVVAANGAVPALLRIISQLSPGGKNGAEDDGEDTEDVLQDALEAICCLLGDGTKASRKKDAKEEEAVSQRAADVAELVVRHTENAKQLLRLLQVRDTSTQIDAMVLIQRVYCILPAPISAAFLGEPAALNQLMDRLQNCPVEPVRNECLNLWLLLTESNADIQTIVTVQGFVETIFIILEEEDLTMGGKVARDLLRCLMNLVGNTTCQKYILHSEGIVSLVLAISTAIRGHRVAGEVSETDRGFVEEDRIDVPEESRWLCLGLLVDAALALAGQQLGQRGGSNGEDVAVVAEAAANQEALVRAGALDLCRHLLDAKVALSAKLRLVELLGALEASKVAAQVLQAEQGTNSDSDGALLSVLVSMLVGPSAPLSLRCALGRVLCRAVSRHASLQRFVLHSLAPQIEFPDGQVLPAGRQIIAVLEDAAAGNIESEFLWFGLHLLLAMLHENTDVQSVSTSLPVAIPSDAGPPETFLDLMLRVFPACSRACRGSSAGGMKLGEHAPTSMGGEAADPNSPAAALVAVLKFLGYWLASCPAALAPFARSPVTVPLAMELTAFGSVCGTFFKVQIEGLACLLMGICVKAEQQDDADAELDAGSLMAMVANHVGVEGFQQRGELLWRSEPLQKPPRELDAFRWHSKRFRAFVKEQQRAVQRRMVQLYVSGSVSSGGATLSEDVADHYKQLIRVQDSDLTEVRKENEQLRKEVEAFMLRSLQASSIALAKKMEVMQTENDALHTEVADLTEELRQQQEVLQSERRRLRASVLDQEQQLQSVAVGYEQVERQSEVLVRENARLRASLAAATASRSEQQAAPQEEAAAAHAQVEELERERGDLLELLGRIVAACPEATRFIAPLGAPIAAT